MSIARKIDELSSSLEKREEKFKKQIKEYELFRLRMEKAGVSPNKKRFTIPLSDRIFHSVD